MKDLVERKHQYITAAQHTLVAYTKTFKTAHGMWEKEAELFGLLAFTEAVQHMCFDPTPLETLSVQSTWWFVSHCASAAPEVTWQSHQLSPCVRSLCFSRQRSPGSISCLSRKGNHCLDCSRPGEMLKTCNAPYWQAEIIRAQVSFFPWHFHPRLESGFMGFSSVHSPFVLCWVTSKLTASAKQTGAFCLHLGASRLAKHPSADAPLLS